MSKVTTRVFGVLDDAWTSVCWPLIGLLNLFFRPDPQTGHVALWKVALWLVGNRALLYAAVAGLTTRPLFWTLSAFLLVHILIIASSLRIMYEEKRVMEGAMAADKMTFSALDAVNNVPILASSTVFYILGARGTHPNRRAYGPGTDPAQPAVAQSRVRRVPRLRAQRGAGRQLGAQCLGQPRQSLRQHERADRLQRLDRQRRAPAHRRDALDHRRARAVAAADAMEPSAVDGARAGERHRQSGKREKAPRARADYPQQPPDALGADASRHGCAPTRARRHGAARGAELRARVPGEIGRAHRARPRTGAHPRDLGVDERDGARQHGGRSDAGDREADAVDQGRDRHADEAAAAKSCARC